MLLTSKEVEYIDVKKPVLDGGKKIKIDWNSSCVSLGKVPLDQNLVRLMTWDLKLEKWEHKMCILIVKMVYKINTN